MSEFSEQFEAYATSLRSPNEEIQHLAYIARRNRFAGIKAIELRKMELQLVVANMMREDAKSIVSLIPEDILPTTLILTESHFVEPDDEEEPKQRQRYNKGNPKVETNELGRIDAWMVSERYQRTVEDETQTLIFTPIFVATSGELWIAPKHELRGNDYFPHMSIQEEVGRKRALYRESLRGQELQGRPKRYRTWVDSNSPRRATDEDLIPIERLSVLQLEGTTPEVIVDWHTDLLEVVRVKDR